MASAMVLRLMETVVVIMLVIEDLVVAHLVQFTSATTKTSTTLCFLPSLLHLQV